VKAPLQEPGYKLDDSKIDNDQYSDFEDEQEDQSKDDVDDDDNDILDDGSLEVETSPDDAAKYRKLQNKESKGKYTIGDGPDDDDRNVCSQNVEDGDKKVTSSLNRQKEKKPATVISSKFTDNVHKKKNSLLLDSDQDAADEEFEQIGENDIMEEYI